MQKVFDIFEQIANTSSRTEKENILNQNHNNETLKKALESTYNPFKVYGIGPKAFKKVAVPTTPFNDVFELLDYLIKNNTGTDHDKFLVNSFIQLQPKEHQEWYKRIILKDLKIGITEKTINKIWSNLIPTFDVMLAHPFEKFFREVACEVKVDGVRCICIKQGNSVNLFTRNGKRIEGFYDIAAEIKTIPLDNIVFDGEIIGENYTDTMNKLFAKNSSKKQGKYMIFDALTTNEFYAGESKADYYTRKTALLQLKSIIIHCKYIHIIEPLTYLSNPTLDILQNIAQQAIDQGYEGIMIKDLTAKYQTKRSFAWQKMKLFYSEEFPIIGFEPGEGKYTNTLGKVLIDVGGVTVGVGSGFTEQQRDEIWNNQDKYLGKLIEVQYQEKIPKTNSLRFPTVKSIRIDL